MKKVITFQVVVLLSVFGIWLQDPLGNIPQWLGGYILPIQCFLIATVGGSLYCLRAIYINKCVNKNWDTEWEAWYYIRPLTSAISGIAAYIFLKAGLIILEATQETGSGNYGFLALAFIAGLNVDNFVLKIESIAHSTFGIEKSRSSKKNDS